MLFNSAHFIVFFPIVILVYYVLPQRGRYLWLLAASYYFYMSWNPKYIVLLLFTTAVTYASGRLLAAAKNTTRRKLIVAASFILNLGVLFYFKYINMAADILVRVLGKLHIYLTIPSFDVVLPVGISFFTFQALSYTVDVYRGEIYAEKNFFRYALYVSFFPQLVAGPIERSKNLLKQLAVPKPFEFERAREGIFLMLWGYFLKLVLADRIAIVVDTVYNHYTEYQGWYFIVATVLFAFQIYCDFAGYSTIAIGAAKILGVNLMENFDAPYTAQSVAEFWRRWHISLTSWVRDYLYIPLGGSRKGKLRKNANRMIVFLTSGLWHGASIHFVVWGGINGLYQIIGETLMPVRERLIRLFRLNPDSFGFRLYRTLVTFVLVDLSWVYFRAEGFRAANTIVRSMVTAKNPWVLFDGSLYTLGLDGPNFRLMIVSIFILLAADIAKRCGITIREKIIEQDYLFRWVFIACAVVFILLFGVWGPGYSAANFIYFQF
ncbi:MAG: MBOAT family protein [Lachnospiraceae bacterium]|nr:MBOAT family protein [Lachnospiraceae bacterium]